MSGTEAIAVLGLISSIIAIVDGTKQVHEAASNAKGLPEAFREVTARLPVVEDVLRSVKQQVEKGDVDEQSCKGAKELVEGCMKKAKKLEELFQKVIPADGASKMARYFSAVKTLGKGNRVETLMKGMLEDIQLLAINHGMTSVTDTQREEIAEAIKEVAALSPSLPEQTTEENGFNAIHSGSGAINQAHGDQYNNPGSGQIYHAQTMSFGSNVDLEKSEAQACLTTLFQTVRTEPRDDRERLIRIKGARVDGTCEWIKSNKLFKSWLLSHSQLLWLSGGPGKGKTMLSIFLAAELERFMKDSQDAVFLEYFCDNKDEKRNTAECIIRGLLFQLLQQLPKLFDHILPTFKVQKESLFTSSFEMLWRIFRSMICDPIPVTIYCILDGLDECDEVSLEALLRHFKDLFSTESSDSSSCHLNLIVVSRELPDFIPDILASFPRIRLDPDAENEVNKDIHRFIDVKIDDLSVYRQYPEPLRLQMKEVFHDRARGTFLWVGIAAKMLRKYKATEVEKALELFPPGLEELYARMLLQIDIEWRDIAAKILRWVVLAVRPLTLSELSAAIEPAVETSGTFNSEQVMRDQVSHCGDFLTIKEHEVSLLHQSAKDYLLRGSYYLNPQLQVFHVKEEFGNLEIATRCFHYLQNGAFRGGGVNLRKDTAYLEAFPLLSYAVLYWPEHAKSLNRSNDIFDLSLPFYQKNSRVRESWLKTYSLVKSYGFYPDSSKLLHLASYSGNLPLAENLLARKGFINKIKRFLYVNQKDSQNWTALAWAASYGHEAVVRLLLKKGANIEATDESGRTALYQAVLQGHEAIIRLLLEKGANIEATDESGRTALYRAAIYGHEALVRLLLEKGANIEATDESGGTALYRAAIHGYEAIVRLLLEKGANIEATDKSGETALYQAATYGHEAIIRLLLKKGANIEATDKSGRTALHRAAIYGPEAIVRLLLEKGANIEAKDDSGRTALDEAILLGNEAMLRLLTPPRLNS